MKDGVFKNEVIIAGFLEKDPEFGKNDEGVSITTLLVRTEVLNIAKRISKQHHRCVAFHKKADIIARYLKRGDYISLTGHLQTRSFINKDGFKVFLTEVIIDSYKAGDIKNERED